MFKVHHILIVVCLLFCCQWCIGQKTQSFSFKKGLSKKVEGSFQYTIIGSKDGREEIYNSSYPQINYSGVKEKLLILKFNKFQLNRKEKYRLEFEVTTNQMSGFKIVNESSNKGLEALQDEKTFSFKAVSEASGNIRVQYRIYDIKKNRIVERGELPVQRYKIAGVEQSNNANTVGGGGGKGPIAEFKQSHFVVEVGKAVSYQDLSSNTPSKREWIFMGGNPPNSQSQNPVVFYNQKGEFTVQLNVSNDNGSHQKIGVIQVIDPNSNTSSTDDTFSEEQPQGNPEDSLYKEASTQNDLALYRAYAETYPEGKRIAEVQNKIEELEDINIVSKIELEGVFAIELQYAQMPIEIVSSLDGIELIEQNEQYFKFKVIDQKDHELIFTDARGKKAQTILYGAAKPLLANFKQTDQALVFNISGGQAPYFAEFKKDGIGIPREFPLGNCLEACSLTFPEIKTKLGNEHGKYTIIIKDKNKNVQETLKEKFEFKPQSKLGFVPPTWMFLLLPLIGLIGLIVYKNK